MGLLLARPHDASGHTWQHGDAYLVAVAKYGVARLLGHSYPSAMPIYEGGAVGHGYCRGPLIRKKTMAG